MLVPSPSTRWVVSNQLRRRPTDPMNRAHRHTKMALRPTKNGSRARLISRLATHDPPRDPNGTGFGPDSLRALPPADPHHQGTHEHNIRPASGLPRRRDDERSESRVSMISFAVDHWSGGTT